MYRPPSTLISPGDIFPEIPCSLLTSPLKVSRKTAYTPPIERGPQELHRVYEHPSRTGSLVPPVTVNSTGGEDCLAYARLGRGILLSYDCLIEADLRDRASSGPRKSRAWHVAPIFDLGKVPADALVRDEETGEEILMRDVVKGNTSANYFYLTPLPDSSDDVGHYIDFRKMCAISIEYLCENQDRRIVMLDEDALNGCYNQMMWFFTRSTYLYEPVICKNCGHQVNVNEILDGQELDLDGMQG